MDGLGLGGLSGLREASTRSSTPEYSARCSNFHFSVVPLLLCRQEEAEGDLALGKTDVEPAYFCTEVSTLPLDSD